MWTLLHHQDKSSHPQFILFKWRKQLASAADTLQLNRSSQIFESLHLLKSNLRKECKNNPRSSLDCTKRGSDDTDASLQLRFMRFVSLLGTKWETETSFYITASLPSTISYQRSLTDTTDNSHSSWEGLNVHAYICFHLGDRELCREQNKPTNL